MLQRLFFIVFAVSASPSLVWAQQKVQEISGAGATFPALVYTSWAFAYSKEQGASVRYAATGSSDGIKQIVERKVDFGASDSPLSTSDLKINKLIQFPTMVGGIVPVVNLPSVPGGSLKLTGPVLADLFSGEIKSWDDSRIAALNPGMRLPALKVVRVVRMEGSGSTETFTSYLATQNPTWKASVGVGKQVKWKEGSLSVNGNDGVAESVKKTPGAIGYVSFDRVQYHDLATVALRNAAGQFVLPSESAFQAAIRFAGAGKNDIMAETLINASGADAWPITDITYVLMDAAPKSSAKANASVKFFYWAFLKGDELIQGTGFAPLPPAIQARAVRKIGEIQPEDGPIKLFGS